VYLVDFVECGTGVDVGQAVRALLEDTDVIKLAYSLLSDLVQLNRVFPSIVSANAVCDLRYALTTQRKGASPSNTHHRCDAGMLFKMYAGLGVTTTPPNGMMGPLECPPAIGQNARPLRYIK
jgi:hypothetical protein